MKPTMNRYISKKLDGVEGELPRLGHMLKKSFTASSFRNFWNYWNPIYSYVLTFYVFGPLRRRMPKFSALLITFMVNGLFHDLIVLLITGKTRFAITQLFFLYGMIVILESSINFKVDQNKMKRTLYNLFLLILPVLLII